MSWDQQDFITMKDVGIAYRKAKADLFYERGHPNALALCKYEENLEANLRNLYQKLLSGSLQWMTEPEFVGSWSVMPKGLKDNWNGKEDLPWRPSDPEKAWLARVEAMQSGRRPQKPTAEFRMIGIHSIEFHIVSTLWMLKVGHLYDEALGSEAYGSRLRRVYKKKEGDELGNINLLSLGTFKPYLWPFRQWRHNGLQAMRKALNGGKRVVAVTADVRQFYYQTSPSFLLHEEYLQVIGLLNQLGENERLFTKALIDAIGAWASQTPIHAEDPSVGIPVGLPAARLIANVALVELDQAILRELSPLYYGRYVDDILLVFEDKQNCADARAVWDFVVKRMGRTLQLKKNRKGISITFRKEYLGKSKIVFTGEKQKVFLLEGATGMSLIDSIDQGIRNRASEWRALPEMPDNAEELGSDLISAFDDKGEEVDNLRKADALSTRRAALSISLREMEAFEHDLPHEAWLDHRKVFYKTFLNHFMTVPRVFDFPDALARVFGLAIACGDYYEAVLLLERLAAVITMIKSKCEIALAVDDKQNTSPNDVLSKWRKQLTKSFTETAMAAIGPKYRGDRGQVGKIMTKMQNLFDSSVKPFDDTELLNLGRSLYFHDLGRVPFRFRYFPYSVIRNNEQVPLMENFPQFCDDEIVSGVNAILNYVDNTGLQRVGLPLALLFPTRPFSIPEFYLLAPQLLTKKNEKDKIRTLALAFRGFSPRRNLPGSDTDSENKAFIAIPWRNELRDDDGDDHRDSSAAVTSNIRIAVTSWQTSRDSWRASIVRDTEPDRGRYGRLNRLLNEIMRSERKPHYVILPELSVPARWFSRMAARLAARRISLIAGIEYQHHGGNMVANQVWASLVSDFLGPPQLIICRQDKQRPAQAEERELEDIGNVRLEPLTRISSEAERVPIWHGNFAFGILICSELTNVESRGVFRSRIDALFVPEWNRDTEAFSALVEASALDLHAYIVQCNDRQFGDSRIRAPRRQFWERDIVRIKGGIQDYFVIGEIDVAGLRRFQSWHRSPADGPFKPVPDGFVIDPRRWMLPE